MTKNRSSTTKKSCPFFRDDNDFSLMPGEKREVTAVYHVKDLANTAPVIRLGGWNVIETQPKLTLNEDTAGK